MSQKESKDLMRVHYKLAHRFLVSSHDTNQSFIWCIDLRKHIERKEGHCTQKSLSDYSKREKVHREIKNKEDLVKRK